MKFRTRMILVYSAFVLSAAVLLGGFFYYSSVKRSVNQELRNLEDMSRQLTQQYEESIKAMKNVSHYVLSDVDALEAIRKLSVFPRMQTTFPCILTRRPEWCEIYSILITSSVIFTGSFFTIKMEW